MRICFVLDSAIVGGNEWNTLLTAKYLKKYLSWVKIDLLLTRGTGPMTERFKKVFDDIFMIDLKDVDSRNAKVSEFFTNKNYPIIHVFNSIWVVPLLPDSAKIVLQLGGDLRRDDYYNEVKVPDDFRKSKKEYISNHCKNRVGLVIISDNVHNSDIFSKQKLIDNFIQLIPPSVIIPRKKTRCIWVGRDSYEKRPQLYLAIAKSMPDYEFIFVHKERTSLPIPSNVIEYTSFVDDAWLAELYESSSFLINTSTAEGKPLTIDEAKSHGVITIGPEFLEGIVDYHIQDSDDVDSYRAAIEILNDEIYSSENSLDALREKNRKAMKDRNDKSVKTLINIYDNLTDLYANPPTIAGGMFGKHTLGRKKILNIVATSLMGGVEIIYKNLLDSLDHEKYEIWTFVTTLDGVLSEDFKRNSDYFASVVSIPPENAVSFCLDGMARVNAIKDMTKGIDFDVLHIWNSEAGYVYAKTFEKRIVTGIYGDYTLKYPFFVRRIDLLRDYCAGKDLHIIGDNPNNATVFPEWPFHYIHTGVSEPDGDKVERNEKRIIWLGRNSGEKRILLYIEIAKEMPEYEFYILSTDIPTEFMPLPKNMRLFVGMNDRKTVFDTLKSASIIVNTSYTEGLPLSLLEAMKCGCYPICPRVGGIPYVLKGLGETIDTKRCNVKEYKSAIKKFMHLSLDRKNARRSALRIRAEAFNKKNMLEETMKVWDEGL